MLVASAFMLLVHAASAHNVTPSVVVDSYERAWGLQDVDGAHVRAGSNLRGRLMADLQRWSATPRVPLGLPTWR